MAGGSNLNYQRFGEYLLRESRPEVVLTFAEIEWIIGRHLSPAALTHDAWWSNSPSHPLAKAWLRAGWHRPRGGLDWSEETVTLVRGAPAGSRVSAPSSSTLPRNERHAEAPVLDRVPVPPNQLPHDWQQLTVEQFVCTIEPKRDDKGQVASFEPQAVYRNRKGLMLNAFGAGPFCHFRIPDDLHRAGVYFIAVDGQLAYIGECDDLSQRFNSGYGQISPRNCYQGGQSTNCRLNRLIKDAAEADSRIELHFVETTDRFVLEAASIAAYRPSWNVKGMP